MRRVSDPKFSMPGDSVAVAHGCTCDPAKVSYKNNGALWPVDPKCPIHQPDPERVERSRAEIAAGKFKTVDQIIAERKAKQEPPR